MLVRAHLAAVDQGERAIQGVVVRRVGLQPVRDCVPEAALLSATEAAVDRLPGSIARGQVTPQRPGAEHPHDAIEDRSVILFADTP